MSDRNAPKDPLAVALEQEQNCQEIYYYKPDHPVPVFNTPESVHISFKNELTARNYTYILRALPQFLADHDQLTDLVTELIGIVALQQAQIRDLGERLEHAIHARVAVQAQKDAYENVQATIARGSNIGKQEITVSVRAVAESQRSHSTINENASASSSEATSGSSVAGNSVDDFSGELTGDVKGMLRAVAGLKISGKLRARFEQGSESETHSSTKAVSRVRTLEKHEAQNHRRSDFAGTMTLKVENITGDPVVQARADAIRAGRLDGQRSDPHAATSVAQSVQDPGKRR